MKQSTVIQALMEELGVEDNETEDEMKKVLQSPNIDGESLKLILQQCIHRKEFPSPKTRGADSHCRNNDITKKVMKTPTNMTGNLLAYLASQINSVRLPFCIIIASNYLCIGSSINTLPMNLL